MWIAVLVFAYANGGVTESGVVALAQLLPAMFAAPVFATLADRRSPKALLVSGYVAQGLGCAVVGPRGPYGCPIFSRLLWARFGRRLP
jgi:MFS family permease